MININYLARTKDNENADNEKNCQLLIQHLENVSKKMATYTSAFEAYDSGKLIGFFHDYGKFSEKFQQRIRNNTIKAQHAIQGGKLFSLSDNFLINLFGLIIASHHTKLRNYGSEMSVNDGSYLSKIFEEDNCNVGFQFDEFILKDFKQKKFILPKKNTEISFLIGIYIKILYSSLIDADYTDSEEFCKSIARSGEKFNHELLLNSFNKNLPNINNKPINKIRNKILNTCIDYSNKDQGILSLTVPTGGGKTISSLAFALNHAKKHNLTRIIYVIPYTSIIEQNASVISHFVGKNNVLEHHSNIVTENEDLKTKWAMENWDIPIIVTTNVQFFESFFSNKRGKCRKLHNVANSVIIFDEAQSFSREYLSPCMFLISELVKNYKVTAVLCSATKPQLEKYIYSDMKITEIIENPKELERSLKRVQYDYIGNQSDSEIIESLIKEKSGLVIVNSRKHAYSLYLELKQNTNSTVYCLSTLLPPMIRSEKIKLIKEKLNNNESVFVISTQLIEAGVDIDFPIVFRSIAGLDSIIQAGGRANREGKLEIGYVKIFEPTSESGKIPRALKISASIGKEVINLFGNEAFTVVGVAKYFDLLYKTNENNNLLDSKNILKEFDLEAKKFNFDEIDKKFKLINDNTFTIIININQESNELIKEINNKTFTKETFRKLAKFGVSIYEFEFKKLLSDAVIDIYENIYVLNNLNYFSEETGLDIFSDDNKNAEAYFL